MMSSLPPSPSSVCAYTQPSHPHIYIISGISSTGKSTLLHVLSLHLHLSSHQIIEGDSYHSAANIAKMKNGIALDDEDKSDVVESTERGNSE